MLGFSYNTFADYDCAYAGDFPEGGGVVVQCKQIGMYMYLELFISKIYLLMILHCLQNLQRCLS